VNEFNDPGTDEWQYSIWKIKKISESGRYYKCKWIKKIYDPMNLFKIGYILDATEPTIKKNEREVIQTVFEGLKDTK